MPDLIRHPEVLEKDWIPAFAGMTILIKGNFKTDPNPSLAVDTNFPPAIGYVCRRRIRNLFMLKQ
jgi:hypothetical protein